MCASRRERPDFNSVGFVEVKIKLDRGWMFVVLARGFSDRGQGVKLSFTSAAQSIHVLPLSHEDKVLCQNRRTSTELAGSVYINIVMNFHH